jgi:hypothetical protein
LSLEIYSWVVYFISALLRHFTLPCSYWTFLRNKLVLVPRDYFQDCLIFTGKANILSLEWRPQVSLRRALKNARNELICLGDEKKLLEWHQLRQVGPKPLGDEIPGKFNHSCQWEVFDRQQIKLDQVILKGEVSLYHWPPVWLVWNQLYDNWQFLFLFAKQTNPNQSNRRLMVQWYFPL